MIPGKTADSAEPVGTPIEAAVHPFDVEAQAGDEEAQGQLSQCYSDRARHSVNLSWMGLTVTVKNAAGTERRILNEVKGFVEPRHMLAIMGPSGCGKTTLLDTLAGRITKNAALAGEIRVNGIVQSIKYGKSAYVTQEDELIGALTVRETIAFSAKLRLPQSMSRKEKLSIVDDVINELGLTDAANTFIGNVIIRGISGGQKRRVSIGCELVTGPTLLFLDEPTSGLDAAAAYYVMRTVRKLAEDCRTVVSVIHQPASEVFELFDKLCLLSAGSLVYYGDAMQAINFFDLAGLPCPANRNPADHFLHCINRDFADTEDVDQRIAKLQDTFESSGANEKITTHVNALMATPRETTAATAPLPPWWFQTFTLTHRNLLNMGRNVSIFWLRLGMYVALCLALGLIFLNMDMSWEAVFFRMAVLFFVVAFLTFMAISGFPAFVEDMRVFLRERLNGYYGVATFVYANTLSSLPFIFIIAASSTIVMYFWTNLDTEGDRVPYFILNLFLALVVVESLMMSIAPLVPHYLMGIAAGAGLMGLYMLCCGFFKDRTELTKPVFLYPLYYISFHTYSLHGMVMNEFSGREGFACPCSVQPEGCPNPECTISGDTILDIYGFYGYNKWIDLGILIGMVFIYRFLFYMTLKVREWISQ